MDNNTVVNNAQEKEIVSAESVAENKAPENKKDTKEQEFKFFKCCSASLKRLAIITFIINVFVSLSVVGMGAVLLGVYIGGDLLTLLALPLVTAFIILVVFARLISGLIYGFAEIVEKKEKEQDLFLTNQIYKSTIPNIEFQRGDTDVM